MVELFFGILAFLLLAGIGFGVSVWHNSEKQEILDEGTNEKTTVEQFGEGLLIFVIAATLVVALLVWLGL